MLVGTIDDVIVGYLVADLGAPSMQLGADDAGGPATTLRVTQVWVTPEARELGFGDELLATAIERGGAPERPPSKGRRFPATGTRRTCGSGLGSWLGSSPPTARSSTTRSTARHPRRRRGSDGR